MTDDEWEHQRRTQLTNRATIGWLTLPGQHTPNGQYTHGTRYAYDKKHCRCEPCKEWRREYQRHRYWTRRNNQ